jgi:hypothetical protein
MTFTKQAQLARANASKKSRIGSSKVEIACYWLLYTGTWTSLKKRSFSLFFLLPFFATHIFITTHTRDTHDASSSGHSHIIILLLVCFLNRFGCRQSSTHLHLGALHTIFPDGNLERECLLYHGLSLGGFLEGAADGRSRLVDVLIIIIKNEKSIREI